MKSRKVVTADELILKTFIQLNPESYARHLPPTTRIDQANPIFASYSHHNPVYHTRAPPVDPIK